jgi:hypothetical protein
MMDKQIARAKQLLATLSHASMATVNVDGSPHNTPYLFMRDDALQHLFWGSHPKSEHSKNVARTGQIFVALYDGKERGGLYIKADHARITRGEEFIRALAAHNEVRKKAGKEPLPREYYDAGEQEMYAADIQEMWVNTEDYGADGHITRDIRVRVTAKDLL